jgi:hypothetical protein
MMRQGAGTGPFIAGKLPTTFVSDCAGAVTHAINNTITSLSLNDTLRINADFLFEFKG